MIKKLYLRNWKDHSELDIGFKKGVNFIIGPNGSGKTSTLEAIMYSFTAKVRRKDDKNIFRKVGTHDTELILEFEHEGDDYKINKSFNGILQSRLYGGTLSRPIRNKENIFKYIINLFGTNESFFENIIFSSEGENYEFLKMKAVNFRNYIEDLINLGRTKEFKNVIANVKQFYDKSNEKLRSKKKFLGESEIEKKYGDPTELKSKKKDLKLSIESIDTQIQQKEQELKPVQQSLVKYEQALNQFDKIKLKFFNLYDANKDILKDLHITEVNVQEIISKKNELELKIEELSKKIESINEEIKHKDNEKFGNRVVMDQKKKIQDIIKKLEDNYDKAQSVNCPVCKKLISKDEFLQIHEDNYKEIKKLDNLIKNIEDDIKKLRQDNSNLNKIKEKLKELNVHLGIFEDYKIEDKLTLDKEYKEQKEKENRLLQEIDDLKNEKRQKEKDLGKIIQTLSTIKAVEDFKNIMYTQEYENNLKGFIISEITLDAIEQVLHIQRNISLESLINNITKIWKVFFPSEQREIHFDPDYKPYFDYHGEKIAYENISGGEKMILLILIKTLLIKIYTNISFLILDEPLEHLNLENRIKIVDYLIELCEKNIIDQLIITTFEESLTRKYLNLDKKINIISLPSLKKYKG